MIWNASPEIIRFEQGWKASITPISLIPDVGDWKLVISEIILHRSPILTLVGQLILSRGGMFGPNKGRRSESTFGMTNGLESFILPISSR